MSRLLKLRRLSELYLGLLLLGILTSSGRVGTSDGASMYNVARSLVHRQSLEASPCETAPRSNHCVFGVDGRLYAGFGILPSVLVTPAIVAGETLSTVTGRSGGVLPALFVSVTTLLIGAFIPVVLVLWLTEMGYQWTPAVLTALLLFCGSVLWFESVKGFYSEPFFALFLLTAAYLIRSSTSGAKIAVAGLFFGFSVACRVFGLIFLPVLVLACIAKPAGWNDRLRRLLAFTLGLALPLALVAWSNYVRFGSISKTGYHMAYSTPAELLSHPLGTGIWDVLFNGDVGLLWFTPWILLLPLAVRAFWREQRTVCVLCIAILVESLLFFSMYVSWHGGWAYGPRLLMPCLPFAVLPVVTLFEKWNSAPFVVRGAAVLLISSSVLIQMAGTVYPMTRHYLLETYYGVHNQAPPNGPLIVAQFRDLPQLLQNSGNRTRAGFEVDMQAGSSDEERAARAASAEEYLASFPNAVNLMYPDLWIVKAVAMGVPVPAAGICSVLMLIGAGILLTRTLFRPIHPVQSASVSC